MKKNMLIGGEAGQGLKTTYSILGKTLFRLGYEIHSSLDFMSRIRGGHNFAQVRIGNEAIHGPAEMVDLLVALNVDTIDKHKDKLTEAGVIIYREELQNIKNNLVIPAKEIADTVNPKAVNVVYVGAILKAFGLQTDEARGVLKDFFGRGEILQDNLTLLEKGYESSGTVCSLPAPSIEGDQIYLNGNEATALGALAGGIKYYSAYPMSPATSIMEYIAGKQKQMDVVVEQAEDELAAINMAIGASYGGVRTMTGTSGGGLALMNEAIGLAGITETPVVVADVQRPGPATGLPTRTSQGDLLFVINSSQGEFPIMITAPRNQKNAFYTTFRGLNLAAKYQLPVILLSDQFLADSSTNVPEFDFENLEIKSGLINPAKRSDEPEYLRYQLTEDGISPRAYPGQLDGETVLADSDEHDEKGHIVEAAEKRRKMVEKRERKLKKLAEEELVEPDYYGLEEVEYILIGWGSTYGPLREALNLLLADNVKIGYLSFTDVWPLPTGQLEKWRHSGAEFIDVENNSRGQFAQLIRQETGFKVEHRILKYDGRPFSGREIYRRIKEVVIQ